MDNNKSFESILYTVNEADFENIALELFQFQARNNPVYKSYLRYLSVKLEEIDELEKIPFLPISFFKSQTIQTGVWEPETTFRSSTTTGATPSLHYVKDLRFYQQHSKYCFEHFFGPVTNYHFFALLPSYLERSDSSLIAMMNYFVGESKSSCSGFYLSDLNKLLADIDLARKDSRKIIVWGVSFALLELAEKFAPDLSDCLIFETGGMKGRREEITREQLHEILKKVFKVSAIYSEYGMTELFSQAYATGGLTFNSPPWMKIFIREVGDPLLHIGDDKPGAIDIIDLANVHTAAFIGTDDLGVRNQDGKFEVRGRLDNSDIRGCNLLVE